jgi:hypothetical protein
VVKPFSVLPLVLLLSVTISVGAADRTVPVSIYDGHLSMSLPAGWREIPPEYLEELTMWVADATAGRSVELYQHGYQPPDFEADPWLPHILVQIREGGRLPYGRFLHLQPLEELQVETKQNFPEGLPPLIMGVAVEDVSFDSQRFCVRLEHTLQLRFKGPVRVLTAAFLTERGLLALHYVDREQRIGDGRRAFGEVVRSVTLSPELAYRPRWRDRWPGLPYFIAAGLVAVALAAYLSRRSPP